MNKLFDYDAQANNAVVGGEPAARAVGLSNTDIPAVTPQTYGTLAPGGSNSAADAMLAAKREQLQKQISAYSDQSADQMANDPIVGYNPQTNQVFSNGVTFALDLNEGRQNAGLLNMHNEKLPPGFLRARSSAVKAKLVQEYKDLGFVDAMQGQIGDSMAGVGSTIRDLGLEGAGKWLEEAGAAQRGRNPQRITSGQDIIDKPGDFVSETAGELAYQVPKVMATSAAGAVAGAKLGAIAAPFTGGVSIPLVSFLGGVAGAFLPSLFETYGGIRREQRATGQNDKGRALAGGAGSAALDVLGPVGRISGAVGRKVVGKGATSVLEDIATGGLKKGAAIQARDLLATTGLKKAGKYAGQGVVNTGLEAGTEIAQSAMERWAAFNDLTSDEAINEYIVSGAKGGLGGAMTSPIGTMSEFRDAKNFVKSLEEDMALAADPTAPSALRLAAARRAQDVFAGSSRDPEFQKLLDEFRQKMQFVDTQIVKLATKKALADGTPVNLLDTAPQGDLFNRGMDQQAEAPAQTEEAAPLVTAADPNQMSMFDESGTPTYAADPNFGVSQFEAQQTLQGPTADTPAAQFSVLANQLAGQLDDAGISGFPTPEPRSGRPVTGGLGPMQRASLQKPGPSPIVGGVDMSGLDLNIGPQPDNTADIEMALFGRRLNRDTPETTVVEPEPQAPAEQLFQLGDGRLVTRAELLSGVATSGVSPAAPSPSAEPAGGAFNQAQFDEDLGLDTKGGTLEAAVQGIVGKVMGPKQFSQQLYNAIRDVVTGQRSAESVDPRVARVAAAARKFATAYNKYSEAYAKVTRQASNSKKFAASERLEKRADLAAKNVEDAKAALAEARAALSELAQAVNGNPKDVEVIVAAIKKSVQQAIKDAEEADFEDGDNYIAELRNLDVMLSRGWAAAKTNMFQGKDDIMLTREGETRPSIEDTESGETITALEDAARYGYLSPKTRGGNAHRGMIGVLQYIRFNGNAYDQVLARALRQLFQKAAEDGGIEAPPKVKFIDSGTPGYNPKTHTVEIRRTESNSVVLHEALHAALQWFVYNNPDNKIVVELLAAVDRVINYKGNMGAKAEAVRTLLKNLRGKGRDMDAVLELISYGNTLNEFRRAMDAMPLKGTPKPFYKAVRDVWGYILSAVRSMLGLKNNSEAANVINRTFELMAFAGETFQTTQKDGRAQEKKRSGERLEASIMADVDLNQSQEALLTRPHSSAPIAADVERYNKRILPKKLTTKVLFDLFGWDTADKKITAALASLPEKIRDIFPPLAGWISYVDAHFNVPQAAKQYFKQFKKDKQAGYKHAERLAWKIETMEADKVLALFSYLDGNKSAIKDDAALKELADDVKAWRDFYVQELKDQKSKDFFNHGKFSETMLFVSKHNQIAPSTFGVRKLSSLLGQKTQDEASLNTAWLNLDENGDALLGPDQVFYQVFEKQDGEVVHAGFMAKNKYEEYIDNGNLPQDIKVDPTFSWYHKAYQNGAHRFVANMTAKQAVSEKKAGDLANALRNTMSALANAYGSQQFAQSITEFGQDESGNATATSVVFDSIEDAEQVLGIKIDPDSVLTGNSDQARQTSTKHRFRRPGLWVRVPGNSSQNNATYGALAGKIIRGDVWMAMSDMSNRQPLVNTELVNGPMRWFKKVKTILNPATHMTNIATNVSLSMMHDIPFATVAKASQLFFLYEVSPNKLSENERAIVRAFMNSNAMLGDFSSAEVKKALSAAFLETTKSIDSSKTSLGSIVGKVGAFIKLEQAKAIAGNAVKRGDHFFTELYSAEDNVFRLAAFMKHLADRSAHNGGKLTASDYDAAGDWARESFLDYDIDSAAVRLLRQSALPFVSWPYAMAAQLGKTAVHQPWKIANLMMAYMVLEHAMQELAGGDDEDERLRKSGPDWARERMFGGFGPYTHIRIPFMGDDSNPVYYNMGDYIPMNALMRGQQTPQQFMGQKWWPSAVTPSGPFISAVQIMVSGIDPYTGKPLIAPTASQWEAFGARIKALTNLMTPNIPIPFANQASDKMAEILRGRKDKTDNYAALQFGRWAGFKFQDFNVNQQEIANNKAARAIMQEYRAEIGKLRRAEARFEKPDWEEFRRKQQELLERMREALKEKRGED